MQPSYNTHTQISNFVSIIPMDWYSWLSKTALEPSLVYKYGFAFSGNELQKEDIAYFNHEFLQSMGISVAKHRLEILKLARKEARESPSNSLSKFIFAINKTRKCLNKYVNKLVHHENNATTKLLPGPPVSYKDKWREALSKKSDQKELKIEHPMQRTRMIAKSGPLDFRVQEKLLVTPRSLKLSGPLDRKLQEKLMYSYRSPKTSGPIDVAIGQERLMFTNKSPKVHGENNKEKAGEDFVDHTLWEALFRNMKPT